MAAPTTTGVVTTPQPRVLIADDQPHVLEALRLLLKAEGYSTEGVSSPAALLDVLAAREFDLILMDLNYARDTTSGREGIDLLARLQTMGDVPPIVVMTGWATVGLAVEAMQHGVGDFVEKPWTNVRLLEILTRQIEIGRSRRESRRQETEREQTRQQIALQAAQREQEIDEALAIQKALLPSRIPQISGYRISATWQPARKVGGDYYDVLDFDAGSLGICIADVAGKGIAAALLMANLQAGVRGLTNASTPPDHICERLNELVRRNMTEDRFITLFYAHLDGPQRKLCYTNAGHNAPILVHADGSCERLNQGGGVLGAFEQRYGMGVQQLAPGDRLVLFTDGITEACPRFGVRSENASAQQENEEFGEARLIELVAGHRREAPREIQNLIMATVSRYCGGDWSDDATLIVLAVE